MSHISQHEPSRTCLTGISVTAKMIIQVGLLRFFTAVAVTISLICTTFVTSGFAQIRVFLFVLSKI